MLQDWAFCWVKHGLVTGTPLNGGGNQGWVSGQGTVRQWTPFLVEIELAAAGQVASLAAGLECLGLLAAAVEASAVAASVGVVAVAASDPSEAFAGTQLFVLDPYWGAFVSVARSGGAVWCASEVVPAAPLDPTQPLGWAAEGFVQPDIAAFEAGSFERIAVSAPC